MRRKGKERGVFGNSQRRVSSTKQDKKGCTKENGTDRYNGI